MKTSELTGDALDWAVAKCQPDDTVRVYFDDDTGEKLCHDEWDVPEFNPSTDWSQGGPIIEREMITVGPAADAGWEAAAWPFRPYEVMWGETPLEAAMRCFVESKLGDDVETPLEAAWATIVEKVKVSKQTNR